MIILCVTEHDKEIQLKISGTTMIGVFNDDEIMDKAKQKYVEFITQKSCTKNNLDTFEFDGSVFKFETRNCELNVIDNSLWECTNFISTSQY